MGPKASVVFCLWFWSVMLDLGCCTRIIVNIPRGCRLLQLRATRARSGLGPTDKSRAICVVCAMSYISYRCCLPVPLLRRKRMAGEAVTSSMGVERETFTKSPSSSSYSIFRLLLIVPPTSSLHSSATKSCSS